MTRAGPVDGAPPPAGWRQVRRLATTGSTNADLVALAAAGEPAGLVLVADEQTAGRGRSGRSWTAPPGSALTFSVLLRPHRAAAHLGWLPLLTGLAVVDAVRSVTGVPAVLKWPNDVVVPTDGGEGKLAGILAERVGGPGGGAGAVVVGVGLNVSTTAAGLPVPTATSLLLAGADLVDRGVLLDAVLARLAERYRRWDGDAGLDAELAAAYRLRCATLGRDVRAELPGGGAVTGRAVDLDDAGRLLVRTGEGVRAVGAGDVVHLR